VRDLSDEDAKDCLHLFALAQRLIETEYAPPKDNRLQSGGNCHPRYNLGRSRLSEDPEEIVHVPTGKPVMVDGKIGPGEWSDAAEVKIPSGGRLCIKISGESVCGGAVSCDTLGVHRPFI
jgi:hypothetical protein